MLSFGRAIVCACLFLAACAGRVVSSTADDVEGGAGPSTQEGTTSGAGGSADDSVVTIGMAGAAGSPQQGTGGIPAIVDAGPPPLRDSGVVVREASFADVIHPPAVDATPVACTLPDKTQVALVASDVLADLEGAAPGAISSITPGGGWFSYHDNEPNTQFTPEPASWMPEMPGHGGTGAAVHAVGTGFVAPTSPTVWGAGVGFALGAAIPGGPATGVGLVTQPTDLSAYSGISFYAKSGLHSDLRVLVGTTHTDLGYCECAAPNCVPHEFLITSLSSDWANYQVRFTDLAQPTNVSPVAFDPKEVLTIIFAGNTPVASFDFWIDDIALYH
jgi:hypothetical protein